jgi:tryptophan halogenase
MGQFVEPAGYHPLVDSRPGVDAAAHFAAIADWVDRTVDSMPEHGDFIARNCKAAMAA